MIGGLTALVLLMIAGVVSLALRSTGNDPQTRFADVRPALELRGLMLRGWERDSCRWQLGVRQARSDGNENFQLMGINHGQLWDRHRKVMLTRLNAGTGVIDFKERRMKLFEVSVQMRSSVDVTTDELVLDEAERQMTLSGNVVVRRGTAVLKSPRGVVEDQTGRAVFTDGFTFEDRWLSVTGSECRMGEKGEFYFANTRLVQRFQKVEAEVMTLNLKQKLLSMGGRVLFSKPDFKAAASDGVLDLSNHTLTLRGHVSVTHKNRSFRCDWVKVDLEASTFAAGGRVRAEIRI